ncbi:MAG: gamma-glutamyltransferase [Verrucomicrobia subdivision 3 bacterium]|nr:gamma-glutamyltransferase [Verrucomicrobiota bacterium]MCC6823694.1 gamma-glutamyltransferase [Limisphaerales bacterium]
MTRLQHLGCPPHGVEGIRASLRWRLPFKSGLALAALGFSLLAQSVADIESTRAEHGMVASGHPLATAVGVDVLKSGGNAVDAAVAVGLTLGVVDTANSGIGGGCFMLIRLANGRLVGIDGREMAPTAATRDMFLRDAKGDTELSQTGALASGVPGELAAFDYAVRKFGKKKLGELILPAAKLAEEGFELNGGYAARLSSVVADMAKFDMARAVFFKDGKPLVQGSVLKQSDLAATYRAIAGQGSDWFYRGPFAQAVGEWMAANGGIMTAADLASYHIELREPVATTYRGYKVVSFPPPSSGGVHVVQMLNILEHFDLKSLDEVTRLHLIAEAMKLAFADRAYWLGDPDYANVPRGLISKKYAASLAKKIDLSRALEVPSHGLPPNWARDVFKKHTTHFSVADAEGNWVACTATINTSFGSKVVIPGTGVVLNNQMDDFSVQPGVPNAFGLIGAEANAVAPGKRPLSSMSPTIVLKNGQPIIALGAAGGPKIISAVLMELVAMLDLRMIPAEAMATPRIHHQWSPGELMVEKSLPANLQTALEQRGHKVQELNALSVSHMVARTPDGKGFLGAADPRAGGDAAGW